MNLKTMTKKEKWIVCFLVSVLIAVLFVPMEKKEKNEQAPLSRADESITYFMQETDSMTEYEAMLSKRLIEILENMDGVGKVDAWVRVSEGKEVVISMEGTEETSILEEQDSEGGMRTEEKKSQNQNVITDKEGNPYVIKTIEPKMEGVFVLAEGADNGIVQKNITDAIKVLFDVDAHRIKVAKKKMED